MNVGTGEVIRGFDMGLVSMRVGETRKIYIPSAYGYGKRRMGPIPPNSDLVFEVTLIRFK